ncbi:FkbM family methyltransferase [Vreelandella alkaliphila]|uniref:FkbM family methyltransferase n=1 Tax=Vreelandella alkaliphila TaxID=272774 RepID=UPI00232CEE76|nr:FkbM family methyltransferase [Halomonas alkaliphila]
MPGDLNREDIALLNRVLEYEGLNSALALQIQKVLIDVDTDVSLSMSATNHLVNTVRDVAVCLERQDIVLAAYLMNLALRFRPEGPFLQQKVSEYQHFLLAADQGRCTINGTVLTFPPYPPAALLRSLLDGSYEGKEAELAISAIDRDDRVLELGAGVGFMGITVMRCCEPAHYVAYEANPELLSYIQHNQKLNNISFDIHNAVLLEEESTQPFYVTPAFWGSSLLQPKEGGYQQVEVPALNKHLVMAELLPTVLIIDIEGGESAFFEGLNLNSVMKIIVEIHPQILTDSELTAIYKTLIDAGFLLDFKVSGRQELFWYRRDIKEAV